MNFQAGRLSEERRILLVRATTVRQQIAALTFDQRRVHEAAIMTYLGALKTWEGGRGLYPLAPSFLTRGGAEASERSRATARPMVAEHHRLREREVGLDGCRTLRRFALESLRRADGARRGAAGSGLRTKHEELKRRVECLDGLIEAFERDIAQGD